MSQPRPGPAELAAMSDLIMPMAIRVAATLRIADHLASGPLTAEILATKCGADATALGRLMRYLVARGLFEATDDRFVLGEAGKWLLDGAPGGARKWLDLEGFGGHMDRAFFELLGTVRAGGPVAAGNKTSLTPAAAASYDELMGERARVEGPALAEVLDWARFSHVVDVGGGTGAQLIALLTAFPALRGTLVELPASVEAARKNFAGAGVAAEVVGGDLFELELPKADVFVLRYLLHSLEDDQAVEALRKCQSALLPGGSVLILEASDAVPTAFASMDLLMLVLGHGRERTLIEYDAAAAAAGLSRAAVHTPAAGPRVLEYQRQV